MSEITDTYRTLSERSEGLYKDRGSKFHAYAWPVHREDEIKKHLAFLRKEHRAARHHCYAWCLGRYPEHFRVNDDGEPSGSAGKPILGQIRSFELAHVLVVVVRYFGGTKLGVPGLIAAYRGAAADAIRQAEIVERMVENVYEIHFGYERMNDIMHLVKEAQLPRLKQAFELQCRLTVAIRLKDVSRIIGLLEKFDGVEIHYTYQR